MIRFIGELPHDCVVAFSGGVDSVAIVDFLLRGKKNVTLAFFNHGTKTSHDAEIFVRNFALARGLDCRVGKVLRDKGRGESAEEYWRKERYSFLFSFNKPVITGHHLDDAVETWLFNSIHGIPRVIPYRNKNVIRPFLITPKSEFLSWADRNKLEWSEDESNLDVAYMRNLIRHKIVPEALKVNPGLRKVIKKMYLNADSVA